MTSHRTFVVYNYILILHLISIVATIKWYETPNMKRKYDRPLDTYKRYQELWEKGCCQDTIKCTKEPKYLSMDVFMQSPNVQTKAGSEPTVVIIHQKTVFLSEVFESDNQPRELSSTRLFQIDKGLLRLRTTIPTYCPNSSFITGFSVLTDNKMFFVCEKEVKELTLKKGSKIVDLLHPESSHLWSRNFSCVSAESCSCDPHPVICDIGDLKLMSVAVIPREGYKDNPYIFGFYSKVSKHEASKQPRSYSVHVWTYKNRNYVTGGHYTGYLSEVDIYKVKNGFYSGMYFTNDGNACPFDGKLADIENRVKDVRLTFEDLTFPRKPCGSFQIYTGCPLPWCFNNRFDASFTIVYLRKTYIYFTMGNYFWSVVDQGLPLDIPRVKDAHRPIPLNISHILGNNERDPTARFDRDDQPFPYPVHNIGAAFSFKDRSYYDLPFIYIYWKDTKGFYVICTENSRFNSIHADANGKDIFSNKSFVNYDAAWFNGREDHKIKVYLFDGHKFTSWHFTKAPKNSKRSYLWKRSAIGTLKDFGIDVPELDAVVNRGDTGYFFYNNYYFEVPAIGWRQGKPAKLLSMRYFFDVRKECYANDQKAYEDLIGRYLQLNYTTGEEKTFNITNRPEVSTKAAKVKSRVYVLYFAVAGVVVVVTVLAMCVVHDNRKRPGSRTRHVRRLSVK